MDQQQVEDFLFLEIPPALAKFLVKPRSQFIHTRITFINWWKVSLELRHQLWDAFTQGKVLDPKILAPVAGQTSTFPELEFYLDDLMKWLKEVKAAAGETTEGGKGVEL